MHTRTGFLGSIAASIRLLNGQVQSGVWHTGQVNKTTLQSHILFCWVRKQNQKTRNTPAPAPPGEAGRLHIGAAPPALPHSLSTAASRRRPLHLRKTVGRRQFDSCRSCAVPPSLAFVWCPCNGTHGAGCNGRKCNSCMSAASAWSGHATVCMCTLCCAYE